MRFHYNACKYCELLAIGQIHEQEADGDEYHEHHHLLGLFAHSTFRTDTYYLEASRNPIRSPVPRYPEPSPRSE